MTPESTKITINPVFEGTTVAHIEELVDMLNAKLKESVELMSEIEQIEIKVGFRLSRSQE